MAFTLLLIEDDEIEILKFKKALKKIDQHHHVLTAINGEEALAIVEAHSPQLIFLDLNMPKMSGLEFLSILKNDPKHKFIPVMVFSTSNYHKDVFESYRIGVAGYVTKPLRFDDYVTKINHIMNYWCANELAKG